MERLTRKLEKGKAGLADLCQLYRASSKLPIIEAGLREHAGPHAELLQSRCAFLYCNFQHLSLRLGVLRLARNISMLFLQEL